MYKLENFVKLFIFLFKLSSLVYSVNSNNLIRYSKNDNNNTRNVLLFEIKRPDQHLLLNQTLHYDDNQTNVIILENDYYDNIDYIDQTVLEIKVNVKNRRRKKPFTTNGSTPSYDLTTTNGNYTDQVVLNETEIDYLYDYEHYQTTKITSTTTPTRIKNECHFPFVYNVTLFKLRNILKKDFILSNKGIEYTQCVENNEHNINRNETWCSLTENYDRDKLWKCCNEKLIFTTGGNSNGEPCHFPFVFHSIYEIIKNINYLYNCFDTLNKKGKVYNSCIYKEERLNSGLVSYVKFCATTDNFDIDRKWGYCLDYSDCYFPFFYNDNLYTSCITSYMSPSFCSLTSNFTSDRQWINCPTICEGYPEIGQLPVSFQASDPTCLIHSQVYQLNGMKLRDYTIASCKLKYACPEGFKNLYSEITCRLDGTYDKKALCIPN